MRVLKAKIEVDHSTGGTHYTYPSAWLENKEKIPLILYPTDRSDEVTEEGKTYQIVYPCVPDDVADVLLTLPNFSEADLTEVEAYSEKHMPQRTIITDEQAVLSIVAKAALGQELTKSEKEALDPDHEANGVGKSKSFLELAKDYGIEA